MYCAPSSVYLSIVGHTLVVLLGSTSRVAQDTTAHMGAVTAISALVSIRKPNIPASHSTYTQSTISLPLCCRPH